MKNYDIIIIGAGPGGYVAAIRAAQLHKKVCIVEQEHLGGICLNWGCIPTKSFLHSAQILQYIQNSSNYGISVSDINVNMVDILQKSRKVSKKLVSGIDSLLRKHNIDIVKGKGKILNKNCILVNDIEKLYTNYIVIATGARSRVLNSFKPDGIYIWNYKHALSSEKLPQKIIVVGSGAIGLEFESFYNALGCDVIVLELCDTIAPLEDREVSLFAKNIFEKKGIKIYNNVFLINQTITNNSIIVNFSVNNVKYRINSDVLLMAIGVIGNTENIGVENVGIKIEKNVVLTNDYMQTNITNIFAIGDVAGAPCLAHKASHQGMLAVESICGLTPKIIHKNNIPSCIYSFPQISSVGLTEVLARNNNINVKIGYFPFYANGKAVIVGETNGFVKTIFDAKSGELLGAHMVGYNVTELIHGFTLAKELESTECELLHTIFPHPTLSEMMHESVLHAYKRSLHI